MCGESGPNGIEVDSAAYHEPAMATRLRENVVTRFPSGLPYPLVATERTPRQTEGRRQVTIESFCMPEADARLGPVEAASRECVEGGMQARPGARLRVARELRLRRGDARRSCRA